MQVSILWMWFWWIATMQSVRFQGQLNAPKHLLPPSAHVQCLGESQVLRALVIGNTFTFHSLSNGTYFMKAVGAPSLRFPSLRVRVEGEAYWVVPMTPGIVRDQEERPLALPLILTPTQVLDFSIKKPSVEVASFLANPMVWLMGTSILLMWGLPKMVESIPAQ